VTRKFGSAAFAGEPELAVVFFVVDEVVNVMEHLFAVATNQSVRAVIAFEAFKIDGRPR